jgi:Fe-S-cluster-containing dehydrogenase component/formate-dependent nitrite reductase membrane component NrfD
VRYGFVIDQRKCIGCHACTVACKEENHVPLGAFRTWVKYVEKGTFPATRRYFSVLRCNHCDNAPCVGICPTRALYRRADGIVDLDGGRCIGCKSCMHACPYDALYIDPDSHTAAKCHYCAHRIEVGLEPACVIVCPERAIVAGDLDDPRAEIARLVATEQVQVRKPEQRTRPKVYYLGADASSLIPEMQAPVRHYMWAQRTAEEIDLVDLVAGAQDGAGHGAGAVSRPVYDAPHVRRPWGWKVATYLWTKSIAAGALLVAALATFLGVGPESPLMAVAAPLIALVFLAVTTALLVHDLKRPDRFHYILVKPNWTSWLVWGAWILIAFGAVAAFWLLAGLAGHASAMGWLAPPGALLALAAAGYSAFLFGQAEGRDFWQSPLLLPHLLVSALVAGPASLLLVGVTMRAPVSMLRGMALVMGLGLIVHGVLLFIELGGSHPNPHSAEAARLITRGAWRGRFWVVVVAFGIVAPFLLASWSEAGAVMGAVLALIGLWTYEDLWIGAGQVPALS